MRPSAHFGSWGVSTFWAVFYKTVRPPDSAVLLLRFDGVTYAFSSGWQIAELLLMRKTGQGHRVALGASGRWFRSFLDALLDVPRLKAEQHIGPISSLQGSIAGHVI